jgi:hypothetical protein
LTPRGQFRRRSEAAKRGARTRQLHRAERDRAERLRQAQAKRKPAKPRKKFSRTRTVTGNFFALADALKLLDQNRRGRVNISSPFFNYSGRVGDGDLYALDIKRAGDQWQKENGGGDEDSSDGIWRIGNFWTITQTGYNGSTFSGLSAEFTGDEDGEDFDDMEEAPF